MFPPRLFSASVATQSSVRSGLPRRSAPRNDVASRSIIDAFRRAAGALASRHTTERSRAMGLKLAIGMVAAMLAACGPDRAPEPAAGKVGRAPARNPDPNATHVCRLLLARTHIHSS